MPLATVKPLTAEEKKRLVLIAGEMQSRGIQLPEIPKEALAQKSLEWPLDERGYFLSRKGRRYNPKPEAEAFVKSKARFAMFYGGRGSSKTCSGSQKALKKIMQGQPGAVINPDFENFCLSTWPEFKEWIPWEMVVPSQRNRQQDAWQPTKPFVMVFLNGARVYCKGLKDPDSARGPNLNWVWYDESGRDETGASWQLIIPSVRIGTDPQAWCTQTAKPPSHWSYKFFIEKDIPEDALKAFGLFGLNKDEFIQAFHLSTQENSDNLDPMFYASLLATYHAGGLRERELNGNFVEDGGKIGDSSKLQKVTDVPEWWKWGKQVRYWDMAGTEKKLKNGKMNDPDEAVGTRVLASDEKEPKYCIMDQVGGYWSWDKLKEIIAETALKDGPTVTVVIEQEPGSGGKNQCAEIKAYFKNHPKYPELQYCKVEQQIPTDRVQEAYVWFGYANSGNVYYIDNVFWNKTWIEQVDGFTFMSHDDRVTSTSGAIRWLSPIFKVWKRTQFVALQG